MTREEIIKWLESLKAEIGKSEYRPLWHYAEALDMAIKALEELSKRRKEAKRWKRKALQAELVKHGEWKYYHYKDINNVYVGICECTVCKQREYSARKYCPNCGAKMSRKDDE